MGGAPAPPFLLFSWNSSSKPNSETQPRRVTSPGIVSVLRHLGIDPLGPGLDAAGEIVHLAEARLAQEVDRFGTTSSHLAVDDDLAA